MHGFEYVDGLVPVPRAHGWQAGYGGEHLLGGLGYALLDFSKGFGLTQSLGLGLLFQVSAVLKARDDNYGGGGQERHDDDEIEGAAYGKLVTGKLSGFTIQRHCGLFQLLILKK
jgi:hypothetical protein